MSHRRYTATARLALMMIFLSSPSFAQPRQQPVRDESAVREAVLRWNRIAVDASGLDHTPPAPGESRTSGQQLGPGRSSRAMAVVHLAMFEAINAETRTYESYAGLRGTRRRIYIPIAVAAAAHDTLAMLYPAQRAIFTARLRDDLARARRGDERDDGVMVGQRAAQAILTMRQGDGSQVSDPRVGQGHVLSAEPGHWRPDPISQVPIALGAHWADVAPFIMARRDQFRTPPPPEMASGAYVEAFEEVRAFGGDGITTPTVRTEDETRIGIYWAYDGTPSLCAPPRLYNQVATTIALAQNVPAIELARLLALVNVAMADASVAIWESKYYYDVWRPVTAIREADEGSGPTGLGDGNDRTRGDPQFTPLGAPASNLQGPNFTPPFPAYPSGHAGFGGALFEVLRRFFGRDDIPFTFVSDEYDGQTRGNDGAVRPLWPRTFRSLSEAEEENGQSRIYLGIHWAFDKTEGIVQGRRVGAYVFDRLYTPPDQ